MDALTAVAEWFTVPLGFDFVRRALLVSVVAGVACAVLSCWMTLVGWSLMGDAVSHAVLPGVVLSYLFGLPFAVGALVFGAGSVALIGVVNRTSRVKEDAVIGVVFTAMFALGLVLVSRVPSQTDLGHILFGNVLGVSDTDIWQVLVLAGVVLAVVWYKHRDLTLYAFDPVHAHAVGINPRLLETLLLGLLSVTVVVALQAVGIILVVAMVIVPGATAYLLTDRFERMLVISAAVAVAAAVAGVFLSFHLNVSTGGAIVLAQSSAFTLAYLFSPRQGVLRRRRAARGTGTRAGGRGRARPAKEPS
ncbi:MULTISPECIES: metal ABC transporter permease [Nocardiopsis]|uniref:metal ABC transporter permease n=1 Tax=Nocardiopsis TaxID=2013 RepID=UPI00036DF550|nr:MULTISPECIES: metal ABC transporter permease [Nocardiopsis]ASU58664.1 metal ABC transporter permease [Nocardiopsis dassonvillei]